MSQERCEKVMRLYLTEVVQNGKIELLEDIAAEDMVDHTAVEAGLGTGRSGLEQHVRYFRHCIPDLQITIKRIIASQDEVVGYGGYAELIKNIYSEYQVPAKSLNGPTRASFA
jgi:predicted ester cyclase